MMPLSPGTSRGLATSPRRPSAWAAAINVASNVVSSAVKRATTPKSELDLLRSIDPLRAVASEMKHLTGNLRKLLTTGHPALERVAKYYTQSEGKHMRPLVVLLMSRATAVCPRSPAISRTGMEERERAVNNPISSSQSVRFEGMASSAAASSRPDGAAPAPSSSPSSADDILPTQRRLAEITELIHTASLLHDDVIDYSESRRGAPSANLAFGNKMAVLAGDFLLGRASIALARLRHVEIVELMATSISNLIEGEFLQLKNTSGDELVPVWSEEALTYYLQKTYLKTASLIALSCRSAAVLGGSDSATAEAAFQYGKNLGLAFQLVDDLLDYTRSAAELGKPAGADLQLGLATAPLLFAWKGIPELGALVGRKFANPGDVERVSRARCVQRVCTIAEACPIAGVCSIAEVCLIAKNVTHRRKCAPLQKLTCRFLRPATSFSRATASNRHARWRSSMPIKPSTRSSTFQTARPKTGWSTWRKRRSSGASRRGSSGVFPRTGGARTVCTSRAVGGVPASVRRVQPQLAANHGPRVYGWRTMGGDEPWIAATSIVMYHVSCTPHQHRHRHPPAGNGRGWGREKKNVWQGKEATWHAHGAAWRGQRLAAGYAGHAGHAAAPVGAPYREAAGMQAQVPRSADPSLQPVSARSRPPFTPATRDVAAARVR
jgi:hexaprenyl-diphosphate synthase